MVINQNKFEINILIYLSKRYILYYIYLNGLQYNNIVLKYIY